jgi:hypothetical protein
MFIAAFSRSLEFIVIIDAQYNVAKEATAAAVDSGASYAWNMLDHQRQGYVPPHQVKHFLKNCRVDVASDYLAQFHELYGKCVHICSMAF